MRAPVRSAGSGCRLAWLLLPLLLAGPGAARASEGALTLEAALALARRHAPVVAQGEAQLEAARARVAGASVLLEENPELGLSTGPRFTPEGNGVDLEVALSQRLGLGGRRAARLRVAGEGMEDTRASVDARLLVHLQETAEAFFRALHAERSLALFAGSEAIGRTQLAITTRRRDAEAASDLDVFRARMDLVGRVADTHAARVARERALADLRLLLGMEPSAPLEVVGGLEVEAREDLETLLARAMQHPQLRALEAQAREADAERRLAEASAWPELGLGLSYTREQDEQFAHGVLSFTLPVFNREQGARGEAIARARGRRLELEARKRALTIRIRSAFVVLGLCLEAVEAYEVELLDALDARGEETLQAYEAGEISLTEVFVLREEVLEVRRAHLDRMLEASLADLEIKALSGGLR